MLAAWSPSYWMKLEFLGWSKWYFDQPYEIRGEINGCPIELQLLTARHMVGIGGSQYFVWRFG